MERPLTETELAELLQVSVSTLKSWRRRDIGPAYVIVGQHSVRYRPEDVRAYLCNRVQGELPAAWRRAMKRAAGMLGMVADWDIAAGKREVLAHMAGELHKLLEEAPHA